jgi:hypothetical protein
VTDAVEIASDRRYHFGCSPESFWLAAGRTDAYQSWWPWLKVLRADGLSQGSSWRCVVQPPLPYVVRFNLRFETVERCRAIEVRVTGDIVGRASLDVTPSGEGCDIRLRSDLAPHNPALRLVAKVAKPIAVYGHDWVLDTGARQFQEHALPDRSTGSTTF